MENLKIDRAPVAKEADRLKAIRATLPQQKQLTNIELAQAEFGLELTRAEIISRVRHSIPFRLFRERSWLSTPVELYTQPIPDKALLIYDRAKKTGHFVDFEIFEVFYGRASDAILDPWLIGWTRRGVRYTHGIVLAYWD